MLAINQDSLGAGAEKMPGDTPGLEVWAKPLGARTSGDYAVMLLNASVQNAPMEIRWSRLELLAPVTVRDLWLHKNASANPDGYRVTVPAHSAVLLRVSGTRSWQHGVVYETEWPGVQRIGAAMLFHCAECSRGYAMAMGGKNGAGSLRFSNMIVPHPGPYTLRLQYVDNDRNQKQVGIKVNGAETGSASVMSSGNWVDVPVHLQAGSNEITVSYGGKRSLYLDKVTLLPPAPAGEKRTAVDR